MVFIHVIVECYTCCIIEYVFASTGCCGEERPEPDVPSDCQGNGVPGHLEICSQGSSCKKLPVSQRHKC